MKHTKQPAPSKTKGGEKNKGGGGGGRGGEREPWRGGKSKTSGGGGGGGVGDDGKSAPSSPYKGGGGGGGGGGGATANTTGLTSMRSDGVIVPGGGGGGRGSKNKQKVVKNALRNAQLDKSQLLMWRKFGYGEQLFAQYYKKQRIMPDAELPTLKSTFATPLPITFRLHATDPRAADLAARLKKLAERRPTPLVKPLPWMPEGEGWQAVLADSTGAGAGAAENAAAGSHSHTYIGRREKLNEEVAEVVKEGTVAGLLARQEAVSMLPVLVLAPSLPLQRGSRVLDVCAAPGNKTMQLLERCAPPPPPTGFGGGGGGLVVANDAHPGRVKTLHEAITRHCRSGEEMESLVITCAMGQNIPVPTFTTNVGGGGGVDGGGKLGGESGKKKKKTKQKKKKNDEEAEEPMEEEVCVRGYDAVLTDVPCSGDGTLRKDPDVLRRWHPGGGNCLHATQLAVARRAAELVRPGGLLLYSTCSLNPIEDEAVVAGILTGPGGDEWEIEAGAVDKGAPGMKYRPGVSTWGVSEHVLKGNRGGVNASAPAALYESDADESDSESDREVSLRWYATYAAAAAAGMPAASPTMWPPATPAEAKKLHLDRCARFLPHDQDTGGFFVALLRRREAVSAAGAGAGAGADDGRRGKKTTAREKKEMKDEKVKAAAAARAMGDLSDPVRPLPPGEASAIATHLGLESRVRRRLWLGARGTVTLAPRASFSDGGGGGDGDVLLDLGPIAVAAAGVIALKTRVLAWDEDKDAGGGFPYDFTQAGAEALAALARKRRLQIVPSDLQVMLAARASGVDGPEVVAGENEVLCLTPDEMSDATRRRWEQSKRGAVVFVLLKRASTTDGGGGGGGGKGASSSPSPPPPRVAFAVAGRCSDDGFMLSPELTAVESKRLLARLSEVAGVKNRGARNDKQRQHQQQQEEQQRKRRRREADEAETERAGAGEEKKKMKKRQKRT